MAADESTPKRPRNAAGTRAAILVSARRAFARAGYDGVGVREIAAGAGVTAMLVNRYFGSKERLFAEVAADTLSAPVILSAEVLGSSNVGERMAAALVALTEPDDTALDGFLILLRSASSPQAAEIGRDQIDAHYQQLLTEALDGDSAPQRAAIVFALVAGFQVMRQMLALPAVANADPATLTRILTPLFDELVAPDRP